VFDDLSDLSDSPASYVAVLALVALDAVFPVAPSETVLVTGGVLIERGDLIAPLFVLAAACAARSADSGGAHHLHVRHVEALGAANVDDHHDNLVAHRAASDGARCLHVHAELGHQRSAPAVRTAHLRHRHLVAEVRE
jgi:hypothetical protein